MELQTTFVHLAGFLLTVEGSIMFNDTEQDLGTL